MDPRPRGAGQRSPPALNTSNAPSSSHNRRFSYAETPIDVQRDQSFAAARGTQQQYRHEQEVLHEAETPIEGGGVDGYHMQVRSPSSNPYAESMQATQATQQPVPMRPQRMSSPYGVPEPQGVHPAYYAPVASQTPSHGVAAQNSYTTVPHAGTINTETQPQDPSQGQRRTSTIPMHTESDTRIPTQQANSHSPTTKKNVFTNNGGIAPQHITIPYSPSTLTSPHQPIFAPTAAIGPNGLAANMHQPGQVAHPNMNMQSITGSTSDKVPFEHGLCECVGGGGAGDLGTCLMGVLCPCVLDSKTSYRLGRKSKRLDPTDVLGFKGCNARCALFNCGLCCESPSKLPLIFILCYFE